MKIIAGIIGILVFQSLAAQEITILLWPEGKVPNYKNTGEKEKIELGETTKVSLVQLPNISVYLPAKRAATGQAVIICPGGGYSYLSYNWEGSDVAKMLNGKGIAAIVLKYRLPNATSNVLPHLSPLLDAKRAVRIVRANAERWAIKKDRIGIMGFSAGGHLASTLATQFDEGIATSTDSIEQQSCRPDFAVLVYPVISLSKNITHGGSKKNLIGENADSSLANKYSAELNVTKETPPTFLLHATDDKSVPVENSLLFYQALKNNGVAAELHVFPKGGHGFGLGVGRGSVEKWTELCVEWLSGLNR